MWKQGMIGEMRKRIHRRWNGRVWLLGQAGFVEYDDAGNIVGDDFTLAHDQGEQREWCFICPQCKDVQPYELEQLKYPDDGTPAERSQEVVYECGNCKTAWNDTSKERRKLAKGAHYEVEREAKMPGHIAFHFNVIALHRSPWADIVLEYLSAKQSMEQGISLPMEQFTQKQLAKPWDPSMTIERPDLDQVAEKAEDYANGEPIDGEAERFLTVDVQRDHYWVGLRAWRGDGSSMALYYAKINTAETIEKLREKMKVSPIKVLIDSGYDAGRVYDICVKWGWTAIKGDGQSKSFSHPVKGQLGKKKTEERLYSRLKRVQAPKGGQARLVHLATGEIKDVTARLREGKGAGWQSVANI
jgi:phage terminase large subunit GpA-like protein